MVMEGIQKDIQRITKALGPQVETIWDILTRHYLSGFAISGKGYASFRRR